MIAPNSSTIADVCRAARARGRTGAPGRPMRRRGFTLAELLVSVAVLAALMVVVGMVFSMSTRATVLSTANNEIMNSLRAVEMQIRDDLRSVRRDAFLGLCYNYMPADRPIRPERTNATPWRADWIVFFAGQDFHTLRQRWGTGSGGQGANYAEPLRAPLARIQYGIIGSHRDANLFPNLKPYAGPLSTNVLGRSFKLLASDVDVKDTGNDPPATSTANFPYLADSSGVALDGKGDVYEQWEYEYASLADFQAPTYQASASTRQPIIDLFGTQLIGNLGAISGIGDLSGRRNNLWLGLGYMNTSKALCDPLRMIPGCAQFKIQRWAETDPTRDPDDEANKDWVPRWWPEDGDNAVGAGGQFGPAAGESAPASWPGAMIWECYNGPSDFVIQNKTSPYLGDPRDWPQALDSTKPWPWLSRDVSAEPYSPWKTIRAIRASFPSALKFTITVFDPNGRSEDGQTFTFVVPLP